MKRTFLELIIFCALFLVACSETPKITDERTPGEVAVELFTAIVTGQPDVVSRNIHITDKIQLDSFNDYLRIAANSTQYKESTEHYRPVYTVIEEHVDGENAEVVLRAKNIMGQNVRITVKLLLVDGMWKVDGDHGVWH